MLKSFVLWSVFSHHSQGTYTKPTRFELHRRHAASQIKHEYKPSQNVNGKLWQHFQHMDKFLEDSEEFCTLVCLLAPTQLLLVFTSVTRLIPKTSLVHSYNMVNTMYKVLDDSEEFCTLVYLLPPFPGKLHNSYSSRATQQACGVTNENGLKPFQNVGGTLWQHFWHLYKVL